MCLAQGPQRGDAGEARTRGPPVSSQALYHWAPFNAYKLLPSLSERVIVDGHGCHTAIHFDVKAKENQDKVPIVLVT